MITIRDNINLADFNAWSGAEDTIDFLVEHDLDEAFEDIIDDCYPEGIDTTELNDILRFNKDWIWEALGIETDEEGEPIFED